MYLTHNSSNDDGCDNSISSIKATRVVATAAANTCPTRLRTQIIQQQQQHQHQHSSRGSKLNKLNGRQCHNSAAQQQKSAAQLRKWYERPRMDTTASAIVASTKRLANIGRNTLASFLQSSNFFTYTLVVVIFLSSYNVATVCATSDSNNQAAPIRHQIVNTSSNSSGSSSSSSNTDSNSYDPTSSNYRDTLKHRTADAYKYDIIKNTNNNNNNNNSNINSINKNNNHNDTAVNIILSDYSEAFVSVIAAGPLSDANVNDSSVENNAFDFPTGRGGDSSSSSSSSPSAGSSDKMTKPTIDIQANTTAADGAPFDLQNELLDSLRGTHSLPQQPMYTNDFAVHIPASRQVADIIASKYGFINMGQIGSLKDYYVFHHRHVAKRSLHTSDEHHSALNSEPQVRWMQQQHEKLRKKRDGSYTTLPGYSPYDVIRPGGGFVSASGPRLAYQPTASARIGSPLLSRAPRIQYRAATSHNIFPDPLFKEQWYLNGGAKDGLDMNIGPAWQKGYTGKGVVVSILDDGIQTNHPDLAQNYDPDASFDINGNDSDPTPQDNGDNKHGTRCAGEVAAVAFNNYCGVGVAYNASIGGVRMLDGKVNDVVEAQALSLNPSHIDIYSASWGPEDDGSTVDGPGPLARRAFIYGVTSGRQGKGSIFVWASGNGGRYTDSCNCDGYTNSIFTLSISSATQGGFKPWYLEECSSTLATTYSSGTPGHDKSVATVDMDGRLRPDHICTVEHTGTSASAPLAAGICALALEANPNLTWRDMQYLVVYTSRPGPLEKESGWILNGVKRKYSHKFGYGLMDAGAMVSLAEQWTTVPPQHICKSRENNEDRKIEGTYGYTLATHMDVNGCAGTINEVRYLEHVQCRITLRFFPRGNLRILLTSPMGTTSTLLFERPRDIVKSNFDDWPFLSVHFWGEKAEGRWTLQVINGGRRRVNQPGILSKWQLIFYGTAVQPMRLKSDLMQQQMRVSAGVNPYTYPTESDLGQPTNDGGYYNADQFAGYLNYQNLFTGAGSNPEQAVATVDGHNIPTPQRQNVMADSNNKLVLHDCDPECDSQGCYGRGPTQCVACKHYRLDNTCVSRCPPRSFPNQGGVCWPCHESCETCAGAGQDSCLTCAPAHLHVVDLAVCLQVCPDGYYENYDNKTCVPCEANCASCQDRPDYCTSCEHHLVMHEHKCYSACPLHTYETEDYNCASCHSSCDTCNGSAESQCITCRSGRFAFDGKCLNNCPDGYYADKKRQECVTCPTGCATCSSNGFCLTCHENWTRNKKGKCIISGSENCDESEYYDNNHCHACHSTCETCDGPTESHCLSCPQSLLLQSQRCVSSCDDGFYMEAGICAKCLHTCTQCVSRMNCTACAKGLQLQSGECRTTCADGYYSDRGTCAKCYLSCHTCSGPRRDQCVQCPTDWQLAGGECHPECPEGFYKSEFGCQKCHHYCKTCNGAGPLACTSCPLHFMLDGGLCMECLGSQYYDSPTQTCKTCHDSCRSCSGPGQYSCKTCAFPLHLDRLNNQCVPCCPTDAAPEDQSCCHCDKDTGGCINASPAGKRRIAAAAEQQQFGSAYSGGLYGGLLDEDTAGGSGGAFGGFFSRVGSPLTTITAIAVAACLLVVTVFALIFAVLQRTSNRSVRDTARYNKIPSKSKNSRGGGGGGRRNAAAAKLLKTDAESNLPDSAAYDEDDDDDDEEVDDIYDYHDDCEEMSVGTPLDEDEYGNERRMPTVDFRNTATTATTAAQVMPAMKDTATKDTATPAILGDIDDIEYYCRGTKAALQPPQQQQQQQSRHQSLTNGIGGAFDAKVPATTATVNANSVKEMTELQQIVRLARKSSSNSSSLNRNVPPRLPFLKGTEKQEQQQAQPQQQQRQQQQQRTASIDKLNTTTGDRVLSANERT
ncbi:furin-like protease 2 isoform X2 [Rhagoletis pomonella]|uniref:furin-like protease 2 isoform X2 n=1 Tax=Rhagoletis pomonella TaxID=28610 RepID=UPI001780E5E1|nr:furin-like protease 2 isoform X2 [Rhagoletis pomonella]